MNSFDVFVLPSLTEGTPNVVIEAMAHAKPIIANAVGGVPDLVTEDVGILVPPDDIQGSLPRWLEWQRTLICDAGWVLQRD